MGNSIERNYNEDLLLSSAVNTRDTNSCTCCSESSSGGTSSCRPVGTCRGDTGGALSDLSSSRVLRGRSSIIGKAKTSSSCGPSRLKPSSASRRGCDTKRTATGARSGVSISRDIGFRRVLDTRTDGPPFRAHVPASVKECNGFEPESCARDVVSGDGQHFLPRVRCGARASFSGPSCRARCPSLAP